ncbi:MAG: DUF116 domain-containing protein [Methanocalculus sp. MSAO_Arc1]|uniref:DUF116 domain-containing protein n=1 Tax=Methanocalculus TaxID=71151 RepID=UPI000FEE4B18|nr:MULTISPECIES: DUF116 domain-containing protein [unclassified Methanocalculus]MCP1663105.1 hypothetical protein [Methanocalculus sp. AMF5]RQD81570.1 MAG: DUF116 domain-containing protein [Methanocalculus sp. MSAO_Arc1]
MFILDPTWERLMVILGEVTLFVALFLFALAIVMAILIVTSIRSGRVIFPALLRPFLVLLEGVVKSICTFIGIEPGELLRFMIRLDNRMNTQAFAEIPVEKRAVFLPQCLRSAKCPAHLTPEGLVCVSCGGCDLGTTIPAMKSLGYRIFIIPGSTFIKRMVQKYHPEAIIGVGCLMEVKEGLDMCNRVGLVGMGVVTMKDGCVETIVGWQDLFDVVSIGIDPESIPDNLHISSN